MCLFSCLHQEKNRKSARSTWTVSHSATRIPPKPDTDFPQKVGLVSPVLNIAIKNATHKGQVRTVMLSPPCSSWSSAPRGKLQIKEGSNGKSTRKVGWIGWNLALWSKSFIWELPCMAAVHLMSVPVHKDQHLMLGTTGSISGCMHGVTNYISMCNNPFPGVTNSFPGAFLWATHCIAAFLCVTHCISGCNTLHFQV